MIRISQLPDCSMRLQVERGKAGLCHPAADLFVFIGTYAGHRAICRYHDFWDGRRACKATYIHTYLPKARVGDAALRAF